MLAWGTARLAVHIAVHVGQYTWGNMSGCAHELKRKRLVQLAIACLEARTKTAA
jgi:hypothetical protein